MIKKIESNAISLDQRANNGKWCRLSYYNHPHGCPNFGKRKSCPPFTKNFLDIIEPPFFLVIEEFNIDLYIKKMKEKHPNWTDKQCRNLLYWQKGVKKKLKEKAYEFSGYLGNGYTVLEVPEANGVNVFQTCNNVGIMLERYPQKIIKKVMIIGKKKP